MRAAKSCAPVIDDPAYSVKSGEHHGRIPDRELKLYVPTNPKGYCLEFDRIAKISPRLRVVNAMEGYDIKKRADVEPLPEASEVLGRMLSRFVQLAKVHRNISFARVSGGSKVAPTSVFLTSLFARAYEQLAPQPHEGPLDLFFDIVERLPSFFQRETLFGLGERWVLTNPCALNDNLAESMNMPERQKAFKTWHEELLADLCGLAAAIEGNQGLDAVVRAVERGFGERAGKAIVQRGAERREDYRTLNKAGFVVAGSLPVTAKARVHTYFGGVSK